MLVIFTIFARWCWICSPRLRRGDDAWFRSIGDDEKYRSLVIRSGPAMALFVLWTLLAHLVINTVVGFPIAFCAILFLALWIYVYFENRPKFIVPPPYRNGDPHS